MPKNDRQQHENPKPPGSNKDLEGVDKAPGEERGKGEIVTNKDLKGKKVDADPTRRSDRPAC